MSISLSVYLDGDYSLYGGPCSWPTFLYGDADAAFDGAIGIMQADSWSQDSEALLPSGTKITASWSGENHLWRDSSTHHLKSHSSSGHLRRKLNLDGEGYTTRVILDKYLTSSYKGTVVTSVEFIWIGVIENISNASDYTTCIVSFHPSAASSPTTDWGWVNTTPQVAFSFSAGEHTFNGSLSGGSVTLDDWLYVVYNLQEYDTRPIGTYTTYPSPTATVSNVGFSLANSIILNP